MSVRPYRADLHPNASAAYQILAVPQQRRCWSQPRDAPGAGLWWTVTIALIRLFGFHRSPAADRIITLLGGIALLLIGVGLLASTAHGLISPDT